MIKTFALSSSSKGNAFFFSANNRNFLIDAGISCRQIEKRLEEENETINNIEAVFITHEHTDHIKGLQVTLKKYPHLKVYATQGTLNSLKFPLPQKNINYINANDIIDLGEVRVNSKAKRHDAADPCFFEFLYKSQCVSIITDTGYIDKTIAESVKKSNILYLECNYDDFLLDESLYPISLKNRIKSSYGHLSNFQSKFIIENFADERLQHLFLSHISENSNTETLAENSIQECISKNKTLENINTIMTFKDKNSAVINL